MQKYRVKLSIEERKELFSIINKGLHTSQEFRVSYILLNCDEGNNSGKVTNEEISKVLKVGMRTIDRIKKRFMEKGYDSVLKRKPPDRAYERKIDKDIETRIIALYNEPPNGKAKWPLRLLAEKIKELNYVGSISHETVRRILKKNNVYMESKIHLKEIFELE
jgi:transposase